LFLRQPAIVLLFTAAAHASAYTQRLTTHPAHDYHPKWSPDGQTILFTSQRAGQTGIWMIPAQGGPPVQLPTDLEGDHHISWSPDMKEVVFDAKEPEGRHNVWILTVETGEVRRILPANDRGSNHQPTWSPDGSRIAFVSARADDAEIWVLSLEGGALQQVTENSARNGHPWWTPDGSAITFASDLSGNYDIWMVEADGANVRQVTDGSLDEIQPCVSPDLRLIAFTRREEAGDAVWIRSLASGREIRVPTPGHCGWPTWSPDGTRVACSARIEGSLDILVVDVSDLVTVLHR